MTKKLKNCWNCDKKVSVNAEECPHCKVNLAQEQKTCEDCHKKISADSISCLHCGAPVKASCLLCEEKININAPKCPHCGAICWETSSKKQKLKKCKDCREKVGESARVCPHCGAQLKMSVVMYLTLSSIVTLVLYLFIGCGGNPRF